MVLGLGLGLGLGIAELVGLRDHLVRVRVRG